MSPAMQFALGLVLAVVILPTLSVAFRAFTVEVEDEELVLVTRFGKLAERLERPGLHVLPGQIFPWVKLHRVSLRKDFRDFNDVQLWELLGFSDWQRVKPGTVLMHEGQPGDNFCILAAGEVKVTKNAKLLNVLSAGECFGEMAYLNEAAGTRGADVSTLREATVITVPTEALRRASDACRHSFDRAFLRILVERLSLANTRLTSV